MGTRRSAAGRALWRIGWSDRPFVFANRYRGNPGAIRDIVADAFLPN